jgi:hypothetical protein
MDPSSAEVNEVVELTKTQRFYWRHREDILEKQRERKKAWYNSRPDVIAAREERAKLKEEREKKRAEEQHEKREAKRREREERARAILERAGLSSGASKTD